MDQIIIKWPFTESYNVMQHIHKTMYHDYVTNIVHIYLQNIEKDWLNHRIWTKF